MEQNTETAFLVMDMQVGINGMLPTAAALPRVDHQNFSAPARRA